MRMTETNLWGFGRADRVTSPIGYPLQWPPGFSACQLRLGRPWCAGLERPLLAREENTPSP